MRQSIKQRSVRRFFCLYQREEEMMLKHIHSLDEKSKKKYKQLFNDGTLVRVTPNELRAEYGVNVALIGCGDGDKNMIPPLEWAMPRLHRAEVNFGGVLWLAKSYPDFDRHEAERIRWRTCKGMRTKGSDALINLSHVPCAMGGKLTLEDYLRCAREARDFFLEGEFFRRISLVDLLHVDYMKGSIRKQEYSRIIM